MASKRAKRRRSCEGKRRFDHDAAHGLAWNLSQRQGEAVHAYACGFCRGWHVGHPDKRARQRIAALKARAER